VKFLLIVFALIIALAGLYKRDTWPLWATLTLAGLFALAAVVQIIIEVRESRESAKSKYSGTLRPNSIVLLSAKTSALPKIEIGDGGAIFELGMPQGVPFIQIFEDNNLTVLLEDGVVKVSTIIRNRDGSIVAELIKNEWKINTKNSFDRNYSKDALEVKNDSGDVVLQVRSLEDRIQFQGIFYDAKGKGWAIVKPPGGGALMGSTSTVNVKIEPIFEYPSDLHLGEFRKNVGKN
jgi:hypothetical protein